MLMKIDFYLRFKTEFGQALAVIGNLPVLGNNDLSKALPLSFFNNEFWHASIEIDAAEIDSLHYRYVYKNDIGDLKKEAEKSRMIDLKKSGQLIVVIDTWNDESYFENAFYTTPFTEVFFKDVKKLKFKKRDDPTHQFKIKAPLLSANEALCLLGSGEALHNWNIEEPLLLHKKGDWWIINLDIPSADFALAYKYGVYNTKKEAFVRFENGDNRILHNDGATEKITIVHDGFARLPNNTWKGSGIAIPVFSLRSNNSFGIGEFADIKLLIDWASQTGLKLIQLLPVNDTTATYTWKDSYPYSAISAFALHPIYINLQKIAGKKKCTDH